MKHIFTIVLLVAAAFLFEAQLAEASVCKIVPASFASKPSLATDGYAADIQKLNEESNQAQIQIANRHPMSISEKTGVVRDTDGMSVKLIKLNQ